MTASTPERPANNASKAVWLSYVESRPDITDTTGTREKLIARVDDADAALALESDPHAEVVEEGQDAEPGGQVDDVEAADVQQPQDPDQQDPEEAAREEAANAQPSTPTVNAPPPPASAFANPAGTGGAQGDGTGPGMVNFADGGPAGPFADPNRRDPVNPVHTMVIGRPSTPGSLGTRAGGHVLTDRGWVVAEQAPPSADVDVPTEVVLVDREGARVETADGRPAVGGLEPVAAGVPVEAHVVVDPTHLGNPVVDHGEPVEHEVVPLPTEVVLVDREGARVSTVDEDQAADVEPVAPAGVPVEAHVVVDPTHVDTTPVDQRDDTTEGAGD